MNVKTKDIEKIRPGEVRPFVCDSVGKMNSVCTLISIIKKKGCPKGIVGYETKKYFADKNDGVNILLVHAMGESDKNVLNF